MGITVVSRVVMAENNQPGGSSFCFTLNDIIGFVTQALNFVQLY